MPNQLNFIWYNSFLASVQTYLERVSTNNAKGMTVTVTLPG